MIAYLPCCDLNHHEDLLSHGLLLRSRVLNAGGVDQCKPWVVLQCCSCHVKWSDWDHCMLGPSSFCRLWFHLKRVANGFGLGIVWVPRSNMMCRLISQRSGSLFAYQANSILPKEHTHWGDIPGIQSKLRQQPPALGIDMLRLASIFTK